MSLLLRSDPGRNHIQDGLGRPLATGTGINIYIYYFNRHFE